MKKQTKKKLAKRKAKSKNTVLMTYKVYGSPSQSTTTVVIDLTKTPRSHIYNKVGEVLRKRFGKQLVHINHAGKTVKLDTGW